MVLDEMDLRDTVDDERWEKLTQSMVLLFAKLAGVENNQVQLKAQLDLNWEVIDKGVREQATMAKQLAENGHAIAQLRLDKAKGTVVNEEDLSRPRVFQPSNSSGQPSQFQRTTDTLGNNPPMGNKSGYTKGKKPNPHMPKMPFPRFDGTNPIIGIDKAVNYFTMYDIPKFLWVTASTVAFDDNAAKWLQVYTLQNDLGTWEQFTDAVQEHFGTYDYKTTMNDIMTLKKIGTVQEYYQQFLDAKYQLHMHNTTLDNTFFVQHFVRGLKEELRGAVHSQDPDKLEKALRLASIQEDILAKSKYKPARTVFPAKGL